MCLLEELNISNHLMCNKYRWCCREQLVTALWIFFLGGNIYSHNMHEVVVFGWHWAATVSVFYSKRVGWQKQGKTNLDDGQWWFYSQTSPSCIASHAISQWPFLARLILPATIAIVNTVHMQITTLFPYIVTSAVSSSNVDRKMEYNILRGRRGCPLFTFKCSLSVHLNKSGMFWLKEMSATCCWVFQAVLWCSMSWLKTLLNHTTRRATWISNHSWNENCILDISKSSPALVVDMRVVFEWWGFSYRSNNSLWSICQAHMSRPTHCHSVTVI